MLIVPFPNCQFCFSCKTTFTARSVTMQMNALTFITSFPLIWYSKNLFLCKHTYFLHTLKFRYSNICQVFFFSLLYFLTLLNSVVVLPIFVVLIKLAINYMFIANFMVLRKLKVDWHAHVNVRVTF